MKKTRYFIFIFIAAVLTGYFFLTTLFAKETLAVRAGHFSTATHAPALIGRARGDFESALGPAVRIDWKIFNAGSLAIEALFAGAIDILYVGPNPAVNGFVRSQGEALRIVAGVASGGSAFLVRKNSGIQKFEDIHGKRVATPQIGNSQDVALRYFMKEKDLAPKAQGGNVDIFSNIVSGDQLTVLAQSQVDAIWTVEPWVSRLQSEVGAEVLFEESSLWPDGKYATSLIVVRKNFLEERPDIVATWVRTHSELIEWMAAHDAEAKQIFNEELKRETGKALPAAYLDSCFKRIFFTVDPMKDSVEISADRAFQIGFLKQKPDLKDLFDLRFLEKK